MRFPKLSASRFTAIAILVIAVFQLNTLRTQDDFIGQKRWKQQGVIKWDVQEYYMYLPATFIYHDISMSYLDTLKGPLRDHYWAAKSEKGRWTGRFSIGMAVAYAPFFLLSDRIANIAGAPRDGFSQPYQFGIYVSGFFYSLIGFLCLGLSLRRFFGDLVSALTVLCVGLGTNLYYYSTTEGAMTHAVLFCLFSIFMYCTIRWHGSPKLKFLVPLALVFGLAVLIRPTTILVVLVFFLYGVGGSQSLRQKIKFLRNQGWQFFIILALLAIMALPQMFYWQYQTGKLVYYSYTGENFFFTHPRIWKGLFSYRKGWLLYTPMMALAFIGFIFLRKYAKELFLPILIFALVNIYVVLSWWCWWYGGGFGLRAFIESYAFLAFPLAALWKWALQKGWITGTILGVLAIFFIRLNLFQSAQYREGMLHWDSMSKKMYWQTFLNRGYVKDADKILDPPDYDAAKKGFSEEKRK